MEERKKTKLCPFCDGSLDIDAVSCYFCGRNIDTNSYIKANTQNENQEEEKEDVSYKPIYIPKEEDLEEKTSPEPTNTDPIFINILFFIIGISLLIFSSFLYLFSSNEEIIFKLNTKPWFFYFLGAIPFIIISFKCFKKKTKSLNEDNKNFS